MDFFEELLPITFVNFLRRFFEGSAIIVDFQGDILNNNRGFLRIF